MKKLLEFIKLLFKFDSTDKALKDLWPPGDITATLNKTMNFRRRNSIKKSVFWKIRMPALKLVLKRKIFTSTSAVGSLYINGEFECYTLEDEDKLGRGEKKVWAETAIPYGTYEVRIGYSPKFKRRLPFIKDVPGFKGIRIHPGNKAADTEGCILVGQTMRTDWVGQSRKAFEKLFKKLDKAYKEKQTITLEII